jgi:hypothetical protein
VEGDAPGILALEGAVEIVDVDEIFAAVVGLAEEQAEIDESKHDTADVGGGADAPMIEDESGENTEAEESEVTARLGELASGDVAALGEPGLAILEGGEHEEVCTLLEARLAQADLIHDPISKRQLRHFHSTATR